MHLTNSYHFITTTNRWLTKLGNYNLSHTGNTIIAIHHDILNKLQDISMQLTITGEAISCYECVQIDVEMANDALAEELQQLVRSQLLGGQELRSCGEPIEKICDEASKCGTTKMAYVSTLYSFAIATIELIHLY